MPRTANGAGETRDKTALTHRGVEALRPAAAPYRIPDLRCPGLAIRVAPSGLKTWDVAYRIRGAGSAGRDGSAKDFKASSSVTGSDSNITPPIAASFNGASLGEV